MIACMDLAMCPSVCSLFGDFKYEGMILKEDEESEEWWATANDLKAVTCIPADVHTNSLIDYGDALTFKCTLSPMMVRIKNAKTYQLQSISIRTLH